MNETESVVSRGHIKHRVCLPIIPTDRRFFICTLVGAAILLWTVTGIRKIENVTGTAKVPLSALQSRPAPSVCGVTFKGLGSLRLQSIRPVRSANYGDWYDVGDKYARSCPDRQEKFDTKFVVTQPESFLVMRSIQMAQYNMDRLTFAPDELPRNLPSATQFEIKNGRISRVSAANRRWHDAPYGPSMYIPEKISVGLDVNMTQGKPYIGVAFVVPFGS